MYHSLTNKRSIDLRNKNPESVPYSGLVGDCDSLDEALKNAHSLLTASAHHNTYRIQRLYVADVMTALQLIQNTLSKNYEVYRKVDQDTE